MYRLLGDSVRDVRLRLERSFMSALVDLPMPCGTGECHACAVETSRGIKLACTQGPVFDWMELENRRAR
jgi:ferredoxin